jgi:chromate transport protein ChrA
MGAMKGALEVLGVFLKLGLTSFGGPTAHIGYFREEFVVRRRWIADAQAILRGVNATVVGLLGAALYDPIWTSSVKSAADVSVALAGFALLSVWRAPPLLIVIMGAASGLMLVAR